MTTSGVWDLQEVRDKQLASEWDYIAPDDPNRLMVWGKNNYGALGLNQPANTAYSSPVSLPGSWTSLYQSMDSNTRFVAKTAGSLWTWGHYGEYGALGLNQANPSGGVSSPTQIPGTTWANVHAWNHAGVAVKTDGTMWAWGSNTYGTLGQNNRTHQSSPVQVGTNTTWSSTGGKIGGGSGFGAIKTDGTLWMWGRNWRGGLGLNDINFRSSPTQVGTATNWKTIYGNGLSFGASKTDGTMWVWGRSWGGGLGQNQGANNDSNSRSSPTQIPGTDWAIVTGRGAVGIASKTDGSLWSWGYNIRGELGQNGSGPSSQKSSPVQVGTDTNWPKADANFDQLFNQPSLSGAIKTDGTLWMWAANTSGQLGQNDTDHRSSPCQIPGTWDQFTGTGWDGSVIARTPG